MKFALRQLLKTPGFTVVALLTLALGIGVNTAIFSLIKSVLLRPLPYPNQEQLVVLWETMTNFGEASISWPDLNDWQRDNTAFSALAGYRRDNFTLTGDGEPEVLRGARTSASLAEAIGMPMLRGRFFSAEEDKPGAPGCVVLGYGLWQRKYGGRDAVLGQAITLNGESYTIIGVLPAEFNSPTRCDFWTQLGRMAGERGFQTRGNHPGIYAIGRMKPGHTFESALADLRRISARIEKENPGTSTGVSAGGQPLFENAVGNFRQGLWILLGAVALVLLIACANLANLLLARNAGREAELAVRAALGATRGRIVGVLLWESLLLAVGGGALGLAFAFAARKGIVALAPAGVPRFEQATIDGGVLAATCALSLLTALIFGLLPAWKSARPDLRSALQSGGRTGSAGPGASRARETLVVLEVALTLVLLVGAGLLLRSFARAQSANLGFDAAAVISARVSVPAKSYDTDEKTRAFGERVLERLRALPEVKSADIATNSPLNTGWQTSFNAAGRPRPSAGQWPHVEMNIVSDTYFKTLQIPLLRGRVFSPEDTAASPLSMIIDQAFAEKYWPGADPLGKQIDLGGGDRVATVVGVVPTLKVYGYASEPKLVQGYLSTRQNAPRNYMLLVRAQRDGPGLASALRRAVAEVDPTQAVWDVRTLEDRIESTFSTPRLYTFLLAIFAGLALALSAVGLYGVLAFQVSRRTREFGIRMALGALHSQVLGLVLRRGLLLLTAGIALGLAGALALGRILGALLYQTDALDPVVFGGVTALLLAIALLACWLPARRATRVNPIVALRAE